VQAALDFAKESLGLGNDLDVLAAEAELLLTRGRAKSCLALSSRYGAHCRRAPVSQRSVGRSPECMQRHASR